MQTEDVLLILRAAKSRRDMVAAVSQLKSVPSEGLFEMLFPIAISQQAVGKPVAACALALHRLDPPCTLALDEAIEQALRAWDISIEEVPWYLAQQFGRDRVLAALRAVEPESREQAVRVDSLEYWLGMLDR